jgi:hypothetical protein
MKRSILLLLAISFVLFSCKKIVEKAAQDALLSLMTTGQWKMSKYTANGSDITPEWNGYTFKFYENLTVDAIKNGGTISTGNWNGDYNANTFYADFPVSANDTLRKLNGTWYRDNSTSTSVDATNTATSNKLKLVKQ